MRLHGLSFFFVLMIGTGGGITLPLRRFCPAVPFPFMSLDVNHWNFFAWEINNRSWIFVRSTVLLFPRMFVWHILLGLVERSP